MTIRLRPHHVLCSIGFEGEGYSDAFVANMSNIVFGTLRAPGGNRTKIRFTSTADAICAPCPKRVGLGCEAQEKITTLDTNHAAALGVSPGQELTWGECVERAVTRVTPDDLDRICAGCQWLPLGICKSRLADTIERQAAEEKKASSVRKLA